MRSYKPPTAPPTLGGAVQSGVAIVTERGAASCGRLIAEVYVVCMDLF